MSERLSEKTSSDTSNAATTQSHQLQSHLAAILAKLKTDASSITAEEARILSEHITASDERAGSQHAQAPHHSLLTAAKDLHAAVDGSPEEVTQEVLHTAQSIVSKMKKVIGHTNAPQPNVETELQEEITKIEPKIAQGTVTQAEADHLHSLEARAHGHTERGGITATAQSVVARRERQLSLSSSSGAVSPQNSGGLDPNNKSSMTPQQQSQHDRKYNLHKAEEATKAKVDEGSVTKAEADRLHSLEDRAHGSTEKGGVAASAQSVSARRNSSSGNVRPRANSKSAISQEQSHHAKEENLHRAELAIRPKIEDGTVTAAGANKLHSLEMRAHGNTEKGGLSSKAQSIVFKRRQETLSDVSNTACPSGTDTEDHKEHHQINKEPQDTEANLESVSETENAAH